MHQIRIFEKLITIITTQIYIFMKKISLFLSALLISAISMAATVTVTFDANVDHGTATTEAGVYQIYKDGITLDVSQGRLGTAEGGHYRIYKDYTMTISSAVGNITNVEFTCTANNTTKYGPGCFAADCGEYTYQDKIGTWVGNAEQIVFTASTAQVRVSKVVITYEASSSSVEDVVVNEPATKFIENGQLVIIKDGIRYNAQGQVL